MTGIEGIGVSIACMLIGFGMGREFQRVFGHRCIECGETFTQGRVCYPCIEDRIHPLCPIGETCIPCDMEMVI